MDAVQTYLSHVLGIFREKSKKFVKGSLIAAVNMLQDQTESVHSSIIDSIVSRHPSSKMRERERIVTKL